MFHFKRIALCSVALAGLGINPALAGHHTSHADKPLLPYGYHAENLTDEQQIELKRYLDYTNREPCQQYREPPTGFVQDGCEIKPIAPKPKKMKAPHNDHMKKPMPISNVLMDYEVHFGFDSSKISPEAGRVLDRVASEIKQYKPSEVTVRGYTDKAGPSDYNIGLSKRRAEAVSNALTDRGVTNRILDQKAYGENNSAIDTKDGVALRENRRVVVNFYE